jgi:hypothetical protein
MKLVLLPTRDAGMNPFPSKKAFLHTVDVPQYESTEK